MTKKIFDKSLFTLKDSLGELNLFKLAIPHFLDMFFINMLSLVSMVIMNYISNDNALGVSTAGTIMNMVVVITGLVNVGATILISIYMGKGDLKTVRKISFLNVLFTFIINLTLAIIVIVNAKFFLTALNLNPDQLKTAIIYLRIRMSFLFLNSLTSAIISMIRCYGDNKPTLICGIATNIVSTSLNILVVTKYNPFPSQLLGVSFAPVIGSAIGFLIAIVYWYCKKLKVIPNINKTLIAKLFKVGAPGGVSSFSYALSQVITTAFIMSLPTQYSLAKNNLSSILFIIYLFGYTLGSANAIMVGRRCGAGDIETADKMHKQNIIIALLCNIGLFFVLIIFKDLIFLIFRFDNQQIKQDTLKIINTVIYIDLFVEIGRSLNHLGEFGLNGVGDVYATTIISISSCWLVSVLLAYVFGIVLNLKLIGIWIAFALDECTRGCLYLFRWRSGKWKQKFIDKKI